MTAPESRSELTRGPGTRVLFMPDGRALILPVLRDEFAPGDSDLADAWWTL